MNFLTYNSLLITTKKTHSLLSKDRILFVFHEIAVLRSVRMYFATSQMRRKQRWLINVDGKA